jgi:hypothetical protein
VVTLAHGPIEIREIHKQCRDNGCPPLRSGSLAQLVKPGQKYGYDLIVQVGLWRYLARLQREEIRRMLLNDHGIELSAGSVSALCDRFLVYLEALHVARAPVLRKALEGGYPMHLDATCERGKGGLFVCLDGWQGWVLWAARIPSESRANLAPVVEKSVHLFGQPIATVRDMGEGCASAVTSLREAGVPDLVCHYHFLAATGKSLFGHLYDRLRSMIRQSQCRSDLYVLLRNLRKYSASERTGGRFGEGTIRDELKALILWVLEEDGRSDAPFPFSLPHLDFAQRCLQVEQLAETWVHGPLSDTECRAVSCLKHLMSRIKLKPRFSSTVDELATRWAAFCELRDVLRLSNAELPRGDVRSMQECLPALERLRLEQIKQAVDQYTADLESRIPAEQKGKKKPDCAAGIILRYLRKHDPSLFGHPVKLDEQGRVVAVVQRTNNVAEHFFGRQKQNLRRRVGRGQLSRDLAKQPAQVSLASNLNYPEYVRLLSGSLEDLPAAFARLDQQLPAKMQPPIRDTRDSQLKIVLRRLLENPAKSASVTCSTERKPSSMPSSPSAAQLVTNSQELKDLSVAEIRTRTTAVIAQRHQTLPKPRDPRLPPTGSVLRRWYRGHTYQVQVLNDGLVWGTKHYSTLTGVATAIKRSKVRNGFNFFGLSMPWDLLAAQIQGGKISRSTLIDLPIATEF